MRVMAIVYFKYLGYALLNTLMCLTIGNSAQAVNSKLNFVHEDHCIYIQLHLFSLLIPR